MIVLQRSPKRKLHDRQDADAERQQGREALDVVVELDKQRRNMPAALEAVEEAFDTVFMAIAHDGIAQRKPLWRRMRDEGFPAKALREGADRAFLAGEVRADVLRDPLLTRC
jgi:hypothetical protein